MPAVARQCERLGNRVDLGAGPAQRIGEPREVFDRDQFCAERGRVEQRAARLRCPRKHDWARLAADAFDHVRREPIADDDDRATAGFGKGTAGQPAHEALEEQQPHESRLEDQRAEFRVDPLRGASGLQSRDRLRRALKEAARHGVDRDAAPRRHEAGRIDERSAADEHHARHLADDVVHRGDVADRADEDRDQRVLQVRTQIGAAGAGVMAECGGDAVERHAIAFRHRLRIAIAERIRAQAVDREARVDALAPQAHREQRIAGEDRRLFAAHARRRERASQLVLRVTILHDQQKHGSTLSLQPVGDGVQFRIQDRPSRQP